MYSWATCQQERAQGLDLPIGQEEQVPHELPMIERFIGMWIWESREFDCSQLGLNSSWVQQLRTCCSHKNCIGGGVFDFALRGLLSDGAHVL